MLEISITTDMMNINFRNINSDFYAKEMALTFSEEMRGKLKNRSTNSGTQESTGFLNNGNCSVCLLISATNRVYIKYPVIVNNQLYHLNTIEYLFIYLLIVSPVPKNSITANVSHTFDIYFRIGWRFCGPQSRSGRCKKEKNCCHAGN
jgi:hypothetical protein